MILYLSNKTRNNSKVQNNKVNQLRLICVSLMLDSSCIVFFVCNTNILGNVLYRKDPNRDGWDRNGKNTSATEIRRVWKPAVKGLHSL